MIQKHLLCSELENLAKIKNVCKDEKTMANVMDQVCTVQRVIGKRHVKEHKKIKVSDA